jgi:hypothetical protein
LAGAPFCEILQELPSKGGLGPSKRGQKGAKRDSRQMYDTEGPYQVFLWYWLGKYQENTNQYYTKIPNWDTTLDKQTDFIVNPGHKIAT